VWVAGEGFYLHLPGNERSGPIQSLMMLEAILNDLTFGGWEQVSGKLSLSGYYGPDYGPPPEDLTFRRGLTGRPLAASQEAD